MTLFDRAARAAWWPSDRAHRRPLAVLLVAGLVLRVAWVAYAAREPKLFNSGDPWAYLLHGREIASGHGYHAILSDLPTAFYPIGYPLYIAMFAWPAQHGLFPDDVTRLVALSHAILGTLTALFVWVVANRAFGARVALIAAGLMALWPGLILLTASLNLETVYVAFLMGALAVLASRPGDVLPSARRLLLAGALLGLSALVRPFSLAVLGALVVGFGLMGGRAWRRALRATVLLTIPVVLVLTPLVMRNQRQLGTTALSTNMGETFCLDHHVGAVGHFAYPPECFEGFDDVPAADIERVRNDEDLRRGLRFIRDHPLAEVKLIGLRARYMVDGDHDGILGVEASGHAAFLPHALRSVLELTADWWYWLALALAVVGIPVAIRSRDGTKVDRASVLLTAAVLIAIPLELYGYTRFHIPVVPFQAMLAAVTLVWFVDRRQPARRLRS